MSVTSRVRLTEPQRRHYAVLLAMLEETLAEIEAVAAGAAPAVRLRPAGHDLPSGFAASIHPELERVRAELYALAERLGLTARAETSDARRLQALVLSSMVRLEDSTSDKIRGYGAVDTSVARDVDPVLRRMHAALDLLAARLAPLAQR